jgi:uncharacterized protein with PQ loop repeat
MIRNDDQRKVSPIELTITFLKLPLVAGSEDSIKMLYVIDSLGQSEVFETYFMQSLLDYKWTKVRFLAWGFMLIYLGYLIHIYKSDDWLVVLVWAIYFLLIMVIKITLAGQDGDTCFEKVSQWASIIWNLIDLLVFLVMIAVIILDFMDESWTLLRY